MSINPSSFTPKIKKLNSLLMMTIIAVILGIIAAIGIWQYLSKTQEKVRQLSITKAVVVAARPIPAGTKLTDADLAIKQLPAQAVPKDYPGSIESVKGRSVKATIEKDEIITNGRLVGLGAAGGLTFVIPPGQRAVTIRVNEVSGVGGFLNPGDKIDIISVYKNNRGEGQNFSKTILQNVLLLASGDKVLDPNNLADPKPKIVSQVTASLSPQDVERLALATTAGDIVLSLRPHAEETLATTNGAYLGDIYGYLDLASGGQASGTQSLSSSSKLSGIKSVEVILGNKVDHVYF